MKEELLSLQQYTLESLESTNSIQNIKELEIEVLGRKGKLPEILKQLKDLSLEEKQSIGPFAQKIKQELEFVIESKLLGLELEIQNKILEDEWVDPTFRGKNHALGNLHPITLLRRELEDAFIKLGFHLYDGVELDTEFYNFDALNIPDSHPARDMQDTFFVDLPPSETGKWVMRTHTSNLQNRALREFTPPFRVFIPGKVYRYEALDSTHDMTFFQCEGMVVGENITLGNLKHTIETALSLVLKEEIITRFRPGYFPFVEPGLELDIWNPKTNSWLEFMGCGMMHPQVLEQGGLDPQKYNGFAFGFGLTRLAMIRHKITDIREFFSGDKRFLDQFSLLA